MRERPAFTLGVKEEFQIIAPETRELRSHVQEMLEEGKLLLKERVKPEMHQSVIEVGTGICANVAEVRRDVTELRREIIALAKRQGMSVASAGTHPFSKWEDQTIYPDPRYASIVEELQLVARSNLIFGLHVHVGIADRAIAFQILNEARYFLPHLLALSSNSPFWLGRNTGQKIWWDLRPHPFFETIEFRVCDVPMRLDETVAIAALVQAICVKLFELRQKNLGFRAYSNALSLENKWRAARWGIDGKLIDFGKEREVPFRLLMEELFEFVDDVVDGLGSRLEVESLRWILENGSGADRQLRAFHECGGDLRKVVDYICAE